MSQKLLALLVIFLGSALGVLGDFFIKSAGMNSRVDWKLLIIGSIVWMATIPVWFYAFRYAKLGVLGALYSVFTVLLLVVAGFYFHEKLTAQEYAGLALALASFCLLARFL